LFGQRPTLLERKEARLEGWDAMYGRKDYGVQIECHTDAKCLTSRVNSLTLDQGMRKARKTDISDLKDGLERGLLDRIEHIAGPFNPIDALTKSSSRTARTMERLRDVVRGVYEPVYCATATCVCTTEFRGVRALHVRNQHK